MVIHKLNTFNEPFLSPRRRNGDGEEESGVRLAKFAITNPNNGPLEFQGESLRIVDKPKAEAGEIALDELEQADADAILKAVLDFSGLSKAGQEARATFPEGPEPGGATAPDRAVVPLPPNGTVAAAAG